MEDVQQAADTMRMYYETWFGRLQHGRAIIYLALLLLLPLPPPPPPLLLLPLLLLLLLCCRRLLFVVSYQVYI